MALCAAAFGLPGIAEAAIVVASSGPSAGEFPPGRKLGDSQQITLQAGDTVTVLVKSGTRVLRGAGTHGIGKSSGSRRASVFRAFVRPRGASRVRTGAVRNAGPDGEVLRPNLWYVDVDHSGRVCILKPAAIRLWRADRDSPARYRITAGDGVSATADFHKGEMVARWDAGTLPVTGGESFSIRKANENRSQVTFALLTEQPDSPEATAAALIENGCSAQLELLTATLAFRDDA